MEHTMPTARSPNISLLVHVAQVIDVRFESLDSCYSDPDDSEESYENDGDDEDESEIKSLQSYISASKFMDCWPPEGELDQEQLNKWDCEPQPLHSFDDF